MNFYTPIIEVDFMCRRSLVEYLDNNLSELPKEHIYHFILMRQVNSMILKIFNPRKLVGSNRRHIG